jgi:hypothetical protein
MTCTTFLQLDALFGDLGNKMIDNFPDSAKMKLSRELGALSLLPTNSRCIVSCPDSLDKSSASAIQRLFVFTMDNWKGKVYKKAEPDMCDKDWRDTRRNILYRDRYHCLRCDSRFPASSLTIHHLIPRAEGGPDTPTNLVTLCKSCHDFVEVNNLRTRADIEGSLDDTENIVGLELKQSTNDWHAWVYGGVRHKL